MLGKQGLFSSVKNLADLLLYRNPSFVKKTSYKSILVSPQEKILKFGLKKVHLRRAFYLIPNLTIDSFQLINSLPAILTVA